MINSMTGFGRFELWEGLSRVLVELKSVNHRYLDLTIKTSRQISSLEPKIRNYLKQNIHRGKVDCYVHFEMAAEDSYRVVYNEKLAKAYMANLNRMSEDFSIENDVTTSKLASYPDVFELVVDTKDESMLWEMVEKALSEALNRFVKSRQLEGENLRTDLLQKLSEMSEYVSQIEEYAPSIIDSYKDRLTEKVRTLLEEKKVDESRIAAEVIIYADKICVDEELVRLKSHIKEMTQVLSSEEAVGRKLDFMAQELNREANTILSKSNDANVASLGISLKTQIEKIREQVQNLE